MYVKQVFVKFIIQYTYVLPKKYEMKRPCDNESIDNRNNVFNSFKDKA